MRVDLGLRCRGLRLAHELFQTHAKRPCDRVGDRAIAVRDAQCIRAFARTATDALVGLARSFGEAFEQCFIVDALERGEPEVGHRVGGHSFGEQRHARDAGEGSGAQSGIDRTSRDVLDQRGIVLPAQQSFAFARRRRLCMRSGQKVEPELARFGANGGIGILVRDALRQRGIGEALHRSGAYARIHICARDLGEVCQEIGIIVLGDTGASHRGLFGLPAWLVEKSGELHRASMRPIRQNRLLTM